MVDRRFPFVLGTLVQVKRANQMKRGSKNWETIILREWRYCEDRGYTSELWQLVADQPARFAAVVMLVLSGGLYFGPIGGLITGLLVTNWDIWQHPKHYRLVWDALVPFVLWGIAIGVVVGVSIWVLELRICTLGRVVWAIAGAVLMLMCGQPDEREKLPPGCVVVLFQYIWVILSVMLGTALLYESSLFVLAFLGFNCFWAGALFGLGGLLLQVVPGVGIVMVVIGPMLDAPEGATLFGAVVPALLFGLGFLALWFSSNGEIPSGRGFYFWWPRRPTPSEVEEAIQSAPHGPVWKDLLSRLEANRQHPPSVNSLIRSLQSSSWQERFLARHTLIALGGEIVEELAERLAAAGSESSLRAPLLDILRRIGDETKQRLAAKAKRLLCPRCLVRYGANRHRISWRAKVTYYGCRQCQQSREFMDWAGKIAVVLDRKMTEESAERDGILRVNWFRRNGLFDFDVVEIVRASDEEVERFCIHVKNDGDRYRQRRYKRMRCVVSRGCGLRKQTLNMLKDMFGAVVVS